jgi:hypothetical protein
MKLSQLIGNLSPLETEILYIMLNKLRKNEFGTFLKNRVFHKNANTLTNFQNFEKIQITRNHIEMEGYC